MNRNNITYIVFIAVFNSQFYSNYSISCLKSTPTIAYVASCPKNKLEWDNAASRKKCDSIAADLKCAATTSDFQYHCLMNQWQNATIEVCANLFYLQGYCAVYDTRKDRIAENYNEGFECLRFNDSHKCPSRYPSSDAYKYQMCYSHIYSKQQITSRATPTIKTTEQYKEHFIKEESRSGGNDVVQNVFLVLLSLALIIVLLLFLWMKWDVLKEKCTVSRESRLRQGEGTDSTQGTVSRKSRLRRGEGTDSTQGTVSRKSRLRRGEGTDSTQGKNPESPGIECEGSDKPLLGRKERTDSTKGEDQEIEIEDYTVLNDLKTPLVRKDAEKNEKDVDNTLVPDVLNRSSSDEAFLESNSDNKTTPLDEKDKIDPSSMHTKQAIPFVSSHQQMSSMTYDKLEMPTASNDTLPPSSNKEIPDSSRRNLSSLSGSKSPSSNFDVERLPYTRHKEESANVSGFETKMSTPSLRPGSTRVSEKILPLSSEPELVSDSLLETKDETVNIALTEPFKKDEEKKENGHRAVNLSLTQSANRNKESREKDDETVNIALTEPFKKDEEKKEKDHRAVNLSLTQSANRNEESREKDDETVNIALTDPFKKDEEKKEKDNGGASNLITLSARKDNEEKEKDHRAVNLSLTQSANRNEESREKDDGIVNVALTEPFKKDEEKKEKDHTDVHNAKTESAIKDEEKKEKDMENKRTPDALNQSPSDEASPQSNSDNKPTPLDEKDKTDPSSMHTKQATPIVSSHQQLSSMTDSKLEMPTVNTDSRALSSNKEFPPPSISELSSRSGIKSTSSDLAVERPPSTSHMGDSANTSGFKTKIFVPSPKPDSTPVSEENLALSCEPDLVSDSSLKTNYETGNNALTKTSKMDEEKKEKDKDLGNQEKNNVSDSENTEKKEWTLGKLKRAPPPPRPNPPSRSTEIRKDPSMKKTPAPAPPPQPKQ
ncbi:uncharacterized protein LOC144627099 [Crassostrea virginica]